MLTKKEINAVEAEKNWEVKPRNYYLTRNRKPVTFTLKSKHTDKYPLLWFDPEKNEQRALRYATNQNTPFQDEQKGEVTLGHIMFRDGSLMVPKEHQALQKLLSIYHPDNCLRYNEFKPAEIANPDSSMQPTITSIFAALAIEFIRIASVIPPTFINLILIIKNNILDDLIYKLSNTRVTEMAAIVPSATAVVI